MRRLLRIAQALFTVNYAHMVEYRAELLFWVLSGSLPRGCELATTYTAAVTTRAAKIGQAQDLIDLLIGADQGEMRERAGFLNAKK